MSTLTTRTHSAVCTFEPQRGEARRCRTSTVNVGDIERVVSLLGGGGPAVRRGAGAADPGGPAPLQAVHGGRRNPDHPGAADGAVHV